jgi:hypothetical protein
MLRVAAWTDGSPTGRLVRAIDTGMTMMRGTVAVMLLGAGVALTLASGLPASAQTASPTPAQPAQVDLHSAQSHGSQLKAVPAADDTPMRTMYVTMGAMTGYMFAVMPVTMTAITAAAASGVASMWAYDYLIAPNGKAH